MKEFIDRMKKTETEIDLDDLLVQHDDPEGYTDCVLSDQPIPCVPQYGDEDTDYTDDVDGMDDIDDTEEDEGEGEISLIDVNPDDP